MKHATVAVGGYEIPLIGVPQDAVLEECQCCGDRFGMSTVELIGTQFLCARCRAQSVVPDQAAKGVTDKG